MSQGVADVQVTPVVAPLAVMIHCEPQVAQGRVGLMIPAQHMSGHILVGLFVAPGLYHREDLVHVPVDLRLAVRPRLARVEGVFVQRNQFFADLAVNHSA